MFWGRAVASSDEVFAAMLVLPHSQPASPAVNTTAGKGTRISSVARQLAAASRPSIRVCNTRRDIRSTASARIGRTAHWSPNSIPASAGMCRYSVYTKPRSSMQRLPGRMNSSPATRPPRMPCKVQPRNVASCCASGPGSSMQQLSAFRKRCSLTQRFSSTSSRCMTAI